MSETSDTIADEVLRRAMRYAHMRRIPLGITATKQEITADVRVMAARVEQLMLRSLLPDGPVKDGIHDAHLRKIVLGIMKGLVRSEKDELRQYEADQREAVGALKRERVNA